MQELGLLQGGPLGEEEQYILLVVRGLENKSYKELQLWGEDGC